MFPTASVSALEKYHLLHYTMYIVEYAQIFQRSSKHIELIIRTCGQSAVAMIGIFSASVVYKQHSVLIDALLWAAPA